ncbi:MAG: hypothetical protein Q9173_004954 [Seirophora scorigena]
MDVISGVSAPSKKLISTPDDTDIIPQPLRIHKRKRQRLDAIQSTAPQGTKAAAATIALEFHGPAGFTRL